MKTQDFNITQDLYNIPCKLYTPDHQLPQLLVIGVHGFAGDKESSAIYSLAEKMTPLGGAVLCFDFPAHGKSEADDRMLTVNNCRSDLNAVCQYAHQLYPDVPLCIFATSFGGYITLLSLQTLSVTIDKLVLRAPAVCMGKVFTEEILENNVSTLTEKGYAECGFDRIMQVSKAFYYELLANDAFPIMPDMPTLLIRATEDELVDYEDLNSYAEQHPDIRMLDVIGAGHRFKGPGELEIAINAAVEFLLP